MIERGDLVGAGFLAVFFVSLLGLCELWRVLGNPKPESTRKLAHLGSGAGCLALPFLVHSVWVALALALSLSLLFALSQKFKLLKSLHAVDRKSRGSEYYPLAIFLVFVVASDQPAIYIAAVLVLAIGDAFAALIGIRYGTIRYEVEDSQKSLEGSLAFLVISFLAIHLPLLLLTDLPRAHCVLSALLVATLVTMFEAVSLGGTDNLFVPVAVAVALQKITTKPVEEALFQNVSLFTIAILVVLVAARTRWFNVGGLMVVILYTFGAWALGGWLWALPPLIALAALLVVRLRANERLAGSVKVRYVAGVIAPPFLFLIAGNALLETDWWFGPYVASQAAVAVFWVRAHSKYFRGGPQPVLLAITVLGGLATAALVPWLLQRERSPQAFAVVAIAVVAAVYGEAVWSVAFRRETQPIRWTARRFNFSLLAGVAVAAAQYLGAALWHPMSAPDPLNLFLR